MFRKYLILIIELFFLETLRTFLKYSEDKSSNLKIFYFIDYLMESFVSSNWTWYNNKTSKFFLQVLKWLLFYLKWVRVPRETTEKQKVYSGSQLKIYNTFWRRRHGRGQFHKTELYKRCNSPLSVWGIKNSSRIGNWALLYCVSGINPEAHCFQGGCTA